MSARTWHVIWMVGLVVMGAIWVQSSRAGPRLNGLQPGNLDLPAPAPPAVLGGARAADQEAAIVVHVSGAVARPGLVSLPQASRVADAVRGAGGLLPTAQIAAVNLAAPIADAQQVHIPSVGEPVPPVAGGPSSGGQPASVSLNQATVDDLQALPGVGPVLAQRIVDYREANGPFSVVEDLLDVPGIGEGRLAELRKLVRVP